MGYKKKTDLNHKSIRDRIREIPGFVAFDSSRLGEDFPDLVVGGLHQQRGERIVVLVEIKSKKGKLSDGQKKFQSDWNGLAFECRSISDVLINGFGWAEDEAKKLDTN